MGGAVEGVHSQAVGGAVEGVHSQVEGGAVEVKQWEGQLKVFTVK